jgi:branched-chain amino acid transport system substrate-binding protein
LNWARRGRVPAGPVSPGAGKFHKVPPCAMLGTVFAERKRIGRHAGSHDAMPSRWILRIESPAAMLLATLAAGQTRPAIAADKTVTVGIDFPLTGADAESGARMEDGAVLAIDEANAKGGVAGYKIDLMLLDNGTTTAGQYDPAQAATNARKMVSDLSVVGAIGPEMSGSGKAMAPILSQGGLATVTPSATNPDITDPKFAAQFRPKGKAIFFRTITTDAYQGPEMANYLAAARKIKSVYILDDSGAYGVGLADAFEAQANKDGIKVLGHDQLDPKEADYTTVLTKIKSLHPDAIYYGGVAQAGVKVVKQSFDILPDVIKAGGGLFSPDVLGGAGFPAFQGWYVSMGAPFVLGSAKAQSWITAFVAKFGKEPDDYSVTAYDAATVVLNAIDRVAHAGKPVDRDNVRDAIQTTRVDTLQGPVTFDANGDIETRQVSVFRVVKDPKHPLDDMLHQYRYIGLAPPTS